MGFWKCKLNTARRGGTGTSGSPAGNRRGGSPAAPTTAPKMRGRSSPPPCGPAMDSSGHIESGVAETCCCQERVCSHDSRTTSLRTTAMPASARVHSTASEPSAIAVYRPRAKAAARGLSLDLRIDLTHRAWYNQTVVPGILRSEFGVAAIGVEESRI